MEPINTEVTNPSTVNETAAIPVVMPVRKPYIMTEKRKENLAKANLKRIQNQNFEKDLASKYEIMTKEFEQAYEEKIRKWKEVPISTKLPEKTMSAPETKAETPIEIVKIEKEALPSKKSKKKKPVVESESESSSESETEEESETESEEEVVVKKKKKKVGKTVRYEKPRRSSKDERREAKYIEELQRRASLPPKRFNPQNMMPFNYRSSGSIY